MAKTFTVTVKDSVVTFINQETDQSYSAIVDSIFVTDEDKINEVISNSFFFKKVKQYSWITSDVLQMEFK